MTVRSRCAKAVCLTLASAAFWSPQASATSIELSGPDSRFGSPGTISVSAYTSGKSHVLNLAYKARIDSYVATDTRPFGRIDPGCERLARRKVRCPDPAPSDDADVAMGGGNADDRLRVDDTVAGSLDLSGGAGRDLAQRRSRRPWVTASSPARDATASSRALGTAPYGAAPGATRSTAVPGTRPSTTEAARIRPHGRGGRHRVRRDRFLLARSPLQHPEPDLPRPRHR